MVTSKRAKASCARLVGSSRGVPGEPQVRWTELQLSLQMARIASFLAVRVRRGQNFNFPCRKPPHRTDRVIRTRHLAAILPRPSIWPFEKCKESCTFAHRPGLLQGKLKFWPHVAGSSPLGALPRRPAPARHRSPAHLSQATPPQLGSSSFTRRLSTWTRDWTRGEALINVS